ncbi:MAG: hypothetical protein WBW80_00490 [Acidimicrobiales bacterium]|jgi:hypothetical protein
MFEIDLRFNRPLDDKTATYLNYALDDPVIGLLRWSGDDEHTVVTLLVDRADRDEAVRQATHSVAMLWPNRSTDGVEEVRETD